MAHEQIEKELESFNEDEVFYRTAYLARQNPEFWKSYLQTLDPEELRRKKRIVPELEGAWMPIHMKENMVNEDIVHDEIVVTKHNRFTPVFTHSHTFFEMVYVLKGSCRQNFSGQEFVLEEGCFNIITPLTEHSISVFDDSIVLNILIAGSVFEEVFYSLLRFSSEISKFLNQSLYLVEQSSWMIMDTEKDPEIRDLVLSLTEMSLSDKPFKAMALNAVLTLIFARILQDHEAGITFPKKPFGGDETILKMISDIEKEYRTITLQELAEKCGFSSGYTSRLIRKKTGKSFTEIVQGIRFNKARHLLETREDPVSVISDLAGFDNLEHFSRQFKKRYGISPGAYRDSARIIKETDHSENKPDVSIEKERSK